MTERAMIDIETLGTEPGCVIVSIGAVRFDLEHGVTDSLFVSVDPESCQALGMEIDAGTLAWWLGQPAEAREQLTGGDDLEIALRELRAFVDGAEEVWANSPSFDLAILDEAFDAVGLSSPWEFWEQRDYRTLRETLPYWPGRDQQGTKHDALDDARYQAESLVEALREVER